jgi:hypothetical protein
LGYFVIVVPNFMMPKARHSVFYWQFGANGAIRHRKNWIVSPMEDPVPGPPPPTVCGPGEIDGVTPFPLLGA